MMIPLFIAMIEDAEDRNLLIEYYTQHRFTMLHVAQSILHDQGLAEDAMQEAFLRLARHIKNVRHDHKQVRSFLVTIVKNAAIDIMKQQKIMPMVSLDTILYEPADPINTEDVTQQRDEADAAEQLVLSLPVIYSTVFLLRYKHDYSTGDIAKLLEISEDTARKRLQRAKEKIAEEVHRRRANESEY